MLYRIYSGSHPRTFFTFLVFLSRNAYSVNRIYLVYQSFEALSRVRRPRTPWPLRVRRGRGVWRAVAVGVWPIFIRLLYA